MEVPDSLLRALLGAALAAVYVGAWIAGVIFVSGDTARRGLPVWLRGAWVLLALVPMLGLTAYVFYYSRPFTRKVLPNTGTQPRLRITLPHAPADLRGAAVPGTGTMPVAALRPVHSATAAVPAAPAGASLVPGGAPVRLVAVEGPHRGTEFAVSTLPAHIGRGLEAAIRLDDDLGVSRQHAELYLQAGVLRLRDLRSAHGTLVNGFTITDKGLLPGDKIQVGHTLLVMRQ